MEAAALSIGLGRLDVARSALADARRALEHAERPADEARVLLQWGRIETTDGDASLGERMFSAAAGLAETAGDHDIQAQALGHLASRCTTRGDHAAAARLQRIASELRDEVHDLSGVLQHVMAASTSWMLAGDAGRGFDLLSAALDHVRPEAGKTVPWSLVLVARAAVVWLARSARVPGSEDTTLDDILSDAVDLGERGAAGQIRLQAAARATEAGDIPRAATLAEAARADALATRNPVLYLQAAMLTAQHREATRDDVGALKMLHTARGTLHDLLGADGARPVLEVLRATHQRWGDVRWEAARAGLQSLD